MEGKNGGIGEWRGGGMGKRKEEWVGRKEEWVGRKEGRKEGRKD